MRLDLSTTVPATTSKLPIPPTAPASSLLTGPVTNNVSYPYVTVALKDGGAGLIMNVRVMGLIHFLLVTLGQLIITDTLLLSFTEYS